MILDEFFKSKSTAVLAENNLHGGRPDDEVKFFIDSEPAYYAVMDRFGDHIEFRGEDMIAPLRLWGSIQQTAGDAGGAADIAGLEDEPRWVGDALDEQGVAEGSEDKIAKHNAAVAKLPGGQAHRSNHPDLLKKAPKGYSFSVSHKLVPDKQGVAEGIEPDYIAGHCHVMALALKQLHPDWKIRAHTGWDEDAEDDSDYRVDHVYTVAPDGTAYDCRGKFSSEEELVGPDETGGVETQFVDYGIDDIKHDIARGELKRFGKEDLVQAVKFIQSKQGVAEGLNEFAPGGTGGGDSGRWYTDDELADIIGDDWLEDFDVSHDEFNIDTHGEKAKQNLASYANTWFDDKGYNVNVLGVDHNEVDHNLKWYIVGSFHNPRFANEGVAEGSLNEEAGTMVIRKLIAEFNKQISGSPYYPLDYKDVGMGARTRGDGARYKDPGYIFNNRDLKPEDRATWQKEKPVEKFWEFLSDKGARKIGDVSGEFGSDPHSPAVLLGKLIFVFNGRTIAWGSTSRLKNSSVWRQKQQEEQQEKQGVAEGINQQLSVQQLATISDEALDNAYHYGRSSPGNTFGWQANLKSAAYAKQMIDQGITDIEAISDAIHQGWNTTAQAFVQNPEQFDDTEKLRAAGKLEAKLQQRAKLMNIDYDQLPDDEQEKDRVVARALLQALTGQQDAATDNKQLDELSPATLASYKTKAGAAATAADSAGDRKTGDRRFSGIVKATKKQFDQDAKPSAQAVHESRLRVMASIIKTQ